MGDDPRDDLPMNGDPPVMYRVFEYWVRREACRLAAQAAQGQCGEGQIAQRLWSLCIFFENYLWAGAAGTQQDFGYKEPVTLREHEGQ